jgi:hypothetical protein
VVIEVNPEETPVSRVAEMVIRGKAAEIIPVLVS